MNKIFFRTILCMGLLLSISFSSFAQKGTIVAEIANEGLGEWTCEESPQAVIESGEQCILSCTIEGKAVSTFSVADGAEASIRCTGTCLPDYYSGPVKTSFRMCGKTSDTFYYGVMCEPATKTHYDGIGTYRVDENDRKTKDKYCEHCKMKDEEYCRTISTMSTEDPCAKEGEGCSAEKCCSGLRCDESSQICSPKLTLLFLPFGSWEIKDTEDAFYHNAVDAYYSFFVQNTPIKDCASTVKKIVLPLEASASCTTGRGIVYLPFYVSKCAQDYSKTGGYAYDYAVGILPKKSPLRGMASLSYKTILLAGDEDEWVLTHEMGHMFGLNDEYYDACTCGKGDTPLEEVRKNNCLDEELDGDEGIILTGYPWDRKYDAINEHSEYCGRGKCSWDLGPEFLDEPCLGNKNDENGRCIMGLSVTQLNSWGYSGPTVEPKKFCVHCIELLNNAGLNCA